MGAESFRTLAVAIPRVFTYSCGKSTEVGEGTASLTERACICHKTKTALFYNRKIGTWRFNETSLSTFVPGIMQCSRVKKVKFIVPMFKELTM